MEAKETRIALVGIIVEDTGSVEQTNALLHEYAPYIVGRMGLPYRERSLSIISVVVDAPENVVSTLCGKLGQVPGISVKTMMAKTGRGGAP